MYCEYCDFLLLGKGQFSDKNCDFYHIFAQSIDCGYSLELPHEEIQTITLNLCLRAKKRKLMHTLVMSSFICALPTS